MVMTSHSVQVNAAQISPDDNGMAVSCDSMGKIKVWTIQSASDCPYPEFAHGYTRTSHEGTVRHIKSCSADGNLFMSAGADSSVRLFEWDLRSVWSSELCCIEGDENVLESHGHTSDANRLSISSDFSTVVSSSDDKSVIVWSVDRSSRRLTQSAKLAARGWLECVTITVSGDLIAAGDNFGEVKMWQLIEGSWVECETLTTVDDFILPQEYRPAHISHATGDNVGCINLSFSSDTNILLVSRADGMIGVYKRAKCGENCGKFAGGFFSSETAHRIVRSDGCVEVFADILSDSFSVLSVGDSRLRVWDIRPRHVPEFITEYNLSGPGRRFLCQTAKVIVSTWNDWVDIFRSNETSGCSSALHWCRTGLVPFAKLLHSSRVDGFILQDNVLIYGDDRGKIGSWEIIDASLPSNRPPDPARQARAQSRL